MLAKVNQKSNSRSYLTKSTDIHKIYMNYNNGNDYIMLKDSEIMKKSKVVYDPPHLQSLKKDIVINPETQPVFSVDKTVKKYPVRSNLNLLGANSRAYLRTP